MAPEKNFKLLKYEHIIYIALKHVIWRFRICNYFCEISKFRDFMNTLRNFAKSVLLIFPRNSNISRTIYINGISRSFALKLFIICSYFKSFEISSGAFAESFRERKLVIKSRNHILSISKMNRTLR